MLPLYMGLTVYNKTRRKDLVDVLYEKGLSVSYDRVGDGGFVDLTENPDALRRWTVSAPETPRFLMEASDKTDTPDDTKHHEENQTKQKLFQTQVRHLVETIDDMGKPFEEDTSDLYTLDTKCVMSPEVIINVKTAESIGKTQYESMSVECLSNNMKGFYETIKQNSLPFFELGPERKKQRYHKLRE
ncbi:hypothetical protein DPMN_087676 [Dreissena polymorpha]|uniref:Uncharacterized protein n=1 Tax=Dreissena polymorpha TaxID=45954 RepID=A0A9D4KUQ8_DREPO|nr:hypothetical protein DPMN_087676 [Dreissena polymorpha]